MEEEQTDIGPRGGGLGPLSRSGGHDFEDKVSGLFVSGHSWIVCPLGLTSDGGWVNEPLEPVQGRVRT